MPYGKPAALTRIPRAPTIVRMKSGRIPLLLLLASLALAGCRDVKSFLWRQTHRHHGGYVRHEKPVRRMGAFFRKPAPAPRPKRER